ncbi:type II toxin-antitoxin system Phd/YefM family antitoxin [Thermodesulfobacteriota bacterium]
MKTATIGEVQKNFAKILKNINTGEEITITRRGKPVAKITAMGPKGDINWPNFYKEAIGINGKSLSDIVMESREDRF